MARDPRERRFYTLLAVGVLIVAALVATRLIVDVAFGASPGRAPHPGQVLNSYLGQTGEGRAGGGEAVAATVSRPPYRRALASAYGPGLYGNPLACGGRLWPMTHAVAHRSIPCGRELRVCYRHRCQRLLVRDRGPWIAGRELDLTEAAARRFGFRSALDWGIRYVVYREVRP
jgi:hypothetical protein